MSLSLEEKRASIAEQLTVLRHMIGEESFLAIVARAKTETPNQTEAHKAALRLKEDTYILMQIPSLLSEANSHSTNLFAIRENLAIANREIDSETEIVQLLAQVHNLIPLDEILSYTITHE